MKGKTIACLCICAIVTSVFVIKCRVIYECDVEFTYSDARLRHGDEWADAENGRRLMAAAGDCFAQLASESNLKKLANRYMQETADKEDNLADVYSVLSGMQFAITERPGTNFVMRCRISLKSRQRRHFPEMARLCIDSYARFVERGNASMLDKAVYREHVEWVKCKRRIEELERQASTGQMVSVALASEKSKLALLSDEEEKARERAKEHGIQTVTDAVVRPPVPLLRARSVFHRK